MKLFSLVVLILFFATGCVTQTREQATIVRYVDAPTTIVSPVMEREAILSGFKVVAPQTYQRTLTFKRDPIVGIVKTSKPLIDLRFTVAYEAKANVCMVSAIPEIVTYKVLTNEPSKIVVAHPDYAREVETLMDRVEAKAKYVATSEVHQP